MTVKFYADKENGLTETLEMSSIPGKGDWVFIQNEYWRVVHHTWFPTKNQVEILIEPAQTESKKTYQR